MLLQVSTVYGAKASHLADVQRLLPGNSVVLNIAFEVWGGFALIVPISSHLRATFPPVSCMPGGHSVSGRAPNSTILSLPIFTVLWPSTQRQDLLKPVYIETSCPLFVSFGSFHNHIPCR